jgi:hypothetical protein
MQLEHCNVHFFITAIAYYKWFNFIKSTSASGTGRRSTIVRRGTSGRWSTSPSAIKSWYPRTSGITSTSRKNRRRSAEEEVAKQVGEVTGEVAALKELPLSPRRPIQINSVGGTCRNLSWSKNFWLGPRPTTNAYNSQIVNSDMRMWILISRTICACASLKCVILCTGKVISLKYRPSAFVTWSLKTRFTPRRSWQ